MKVSFILMPSILLLIGLIILTNYSFGDLKQPPQFLVLQEIFRYLNYVVNAVVFISLGIIYFKEKDKESRKPILLIFIAFIFGLLIQFYLGTIAPAISDTIFNSPEYYMPVILIVLVPLTVAYAILKYHLLDVSIVVKNTITYGAATISGAVIYLMGQWIGRAIGTENQGIIAGIFFILFALVFQSTKDRFQEFLTKKFYPEQFAYQKVLIQFSNDVPTIVGTEKILDLTSKTFVEALKINKFGILLRDYKRDILYLAREIGFSNPNCVIEKSNMMAVFKEKSLVSSYPVIEQQDFNDAFPEKASNLIDEGIYSVIPMIVKSKVVGALLFGLKYSGSKFGGKDLELLNAAANQIAISLENARLYQTESEKIKIERDLDLARKIQQGLLPSCIPSMNKLDICGQMIPAMQVGGDYFDLIKISDSKIFVVVGDVSGKGLSASLYMAKLQTMIQLVCTEGRTPKQILVEVNKRLYESLERSWFVTMTLALFDSSTNTVKFCRAGHMPLITTNNGSVNSYKSKGIGLGLESGNIFESSLVEEEVNLESGQIFAFFSDGITEAMNEKNDLFGEEKLAELLKNQSDKTSSELMNEIWESLTKFRGNAEQSDDMTMVLVKVI
jgi:sigma-B regulation protein RsbU (phosphoserine phosphatase)